MKKKVIFLVLLFIISKAEAQWSIVTSGKNLNCLSFPDPNVGCLKIGAGGLNWERSNSFANGKKGCVVGSLVIHRTTAGTVSICNNTKFMLAGQHSNDDYFVDIIPDTTILGHPGMGGSAMTYPIDLNNDGVVDFELNAGESGGLGGGAYTSKIIPKNNNQVIFDYVGSTCSKPMLHSYSDNDTIHMCDNNWGMNGLYLAFNYWGMATPNCYDNSFSGTNNHYIGTKLVLLNDTLLGWIKVKNVSPGYIIIEEYACQKKPEIIEVNTNTIEKFKIYPIPFNNILTIEIPTNSIENTLIIYNISGQEVMRQSVKGGKSTLDIYSLVSGVYFIKLINANSTEVRKIIKK